MYYGMNSFGTARAQWRITHHLKRMEETFDPKLAADFTEKIINRVIERSLLKEKLLRQEQGLPATRRFRFHYCVPDEATHVEIVGVCGAIAPIEECEFIREVDWDRELIEQERQDAISPFWLERTTEWMWE